CTGIALDSSGDAVVAGITYSPNFPTTPGAFQRTPGGDADGFVTELNAAGSGLVYSTFLGGSGGDGGTGITVDGGGHAYVVGLTNSPNFPTTAGAFQTVKAFYYDAFVARLNADGSQLEYSTFLGGNGEDRGYAIALNSDGNAYVAGLTSSTDFPTRNPAQ